MFAGINIGMSKRARTDLKQVMNLSMKAIQINNLTGLVFRYIGEYAHISIRNKEGVFGPVISIPQAHLNNNPRIPQIPAEILDIQTGKVKLGITVHLVEILLENGCVRYAIDQKAYDVQADNGKDTCELESILKMEESETLEFKSSFLVPPDPEDKNDNTFQIKEIIKQATAMANSKSRGGQIYIGISEKAGRYYVSGIENEFKSFAPGYDADRFTASFLNTCKQMTSDSFLESIDITMIPYKGKTVARIDILHKGDIVLYGKGRELYVRKGPTMHRLDDNIAYINMIRHYNYEN